MASCCKVFFQAFFCGIAAERFCVRNSGATAVVEVNIHFMRLQNTKQGGGGFRFPSNFDVLDSIYSATVH